MRRFTELFLALDTTTGTRDKVDALVGYFKAAPPDDAAWAAYFLTGRKLKRLVGTRDLVGAAIEVAGIPAWLFDASYEAVGDLAETIALLLPRPTHADHAPLAAWVERDLLPLAGLPADDVRARLRSAWERLDRDGRFVYGKLITGAFRVGAARQLVYRALAEVASVPVTEIAHRLIGEWMPLHPVFDAIRGATDDVILAAHRLY